MWFSRNSSSRSCCSWEKEGENFDIKLEMLKKRKERKKEREKKKLKREDKQEVVVEEEKNEKRRRRRQKKKKEKKRKKERSGGKEIERQPPKANYPTKIKPHSHWILCSSQAPHLLLTALQSRPRHCYRLLSSRFARASPSSCRTCCASAPVQSSVLLTADY